VQFSSRGAEEYMSIDLVSGEASNVKTNINSENLILSPIFFKIILKKEKQK